MKARCASWAAVRGRGFHAGGRRGCVLAGPACYAEVFWGVQLQALGVNHGSGLGDLGNSGIRV